MTYAVRLYSVQRSLVNIVLMIQSSQGPALSQLKAALELRTCLPADTGRFCGRSYSR